MAFHAKPEKFYDELDHSFNIKAWIDLTCLTETVALMAVKRRKPYLGFCLSDYHVEQLTARIVQCIFDSFLEEGPLHQPQLAMLLKPDSKKGGGGGPTKRVVEEEDGGSAAKQLKRRRKQKTPKEKRHDLMKRLQKLGEDGGGEEEEEIDGEDDDGDEEELEDSGDE